MRPRTSLSLLTGLLLVLPASLAAQDAGMKAKMKDALSAGTPAITANATVMDWEGNVLREGSNGYTCLPTPPTLKGEAPMCLDAAWLAWAQAWQNKEPVTTTTVGFGYMLVGDEGASNTDPWAEGPTDDNDWVVAGPHLMVIVPNVADLDGMTEDYESGVPWVMWKGTPYAHIMVPVGE